MQRLLFLHIQKTAGSTLLKSVLQPNMTCRLLRPIDEEIYRRVKGDRAEAQCLHGHVPYGYHRFMEDDITYITMLRDPIDRAISYYYFIKGFHRPDLIERHPLRNYFDSVSLGEVFANPKFSNTQTRRLAGIEFDRAYPYVGRSKRFRRAMLDAAKKHLVAMPVFGLKERFEESQQRILRYIGGEICLSGLRENATKDRPTIADIAEVRPIVLDWLRAAHDLDYVLYDFATELFNHAPSTAGSATPPPLLPR